jgi:RNA-binding proteins (RRM domain)
MSDSTNPTADGGASFTIGGIGGSAPNLNLSLDELIQQRRQENQKSAAKKKKKTKRIPAERTPSKQQQTSQQQQQRLQGKKPTSAQKALGTGKAKRQAQMAARRGLVSPTSPPPQDKVQKEIRRQQQQAQRPGQKKLEQNCKVYVGNLPWEATWQDLKSHMRSVGKVLHVDIVTDPGKNNRSKGYGIVEFASVKEAQEACVKLNESEFMGRTIYVHKDIKSQGRSPSAKDARGISASGGGQDSTSLSVFVGNLSYNTSWQNLKDHMRQAGNIDKATILQGPDGKSKGCGIVIYQHPKDAQRAIRQLTDSMLDGRNIFVREYRGQSNGASSNKGLSVFVGNLAYETRWQDLKDHMRQAGNVDSAIIFEAPDGRSKGCGIVVYQHPKEAQRALRQMQDTTLRGRSIFVREDKEER